MAILTLELASGESLSVRRFAVREAISEPFAISVSARCDDPSLDLEAIVGRPATFQVVTGMASARHPERRWSGVCRSAVLEQATPDGLSTYRFDLVAAIWLLTQRRDHRIFQHRSAPELAAAVLDRWSIDRTVAVDTSVHPPLPHKVQYAESDYAFFCRVLEEAGIAFAFPDERRGSGVIVLSDRLHAGPVRSPAIAYVASPNEAAEQEFVTEVRITDETRSGAYTLADYDLRRPGFRLVGEADKVATAEVALEQYHYRPGSFLMDTTPSGDTPAADDEGASRHEASAGRLRAQRSLERERADKNVVSFRTNILDLWPGRVFTMDDHPHPALSPTQRLLVTELSLEGAPGEEWTVRGRAVFASMPHRPHQRTTRPRARLQSALVVGGEQVHPDELGRVRVQFAWDRNGEYTCWVRVSQAWAGAGYGMIALPRAGQEVLVDFLEGDPEQPVVVGRLFNQMNPVPDRLPERDTRSSWKSDALGGFNEVLYDDEKGRELFYVQAERDVRRLVKHDDTSTIVQDRRKDVAVNELETTGGARVQETKGVRVELTYDDRTTAVDGTLRERVGARALKRIERDDVLEVGADQHLLTRGVQRERVEHVAHLRIGGSRQESVGGTDSQTVGDALNESVGSYSVDASGPEGWIHLVAGSKIVIESATDVTVEGAGGFVKVDGGGVTIVGTVVKINEDGEPDELPGPGPRLPEAATLPIIEQPTRPPDPPPIVPDP